MEERVKKIIAVLDDKKAYDIESVDLKDKNYIVDSVVIATALNNKHSLALIDNLKTELKPLKEQFLRIEEDENWSVVDLGDIFIHIMTETHREKYNLEELLSTLQKEL